MPRKVSFRRRCGEKVGRPIHPNAGIAAAYARKLKVLVDEMAASFQYFIKAAWRKNEPAMAQDATPAADLQRMIDRLAQRWRDRFDEGAEEMAAFFAKASAARSDAALRKILRDAGFSVKFKLTAEVRDVMRASVEQNVQLIKSIPEQYLTDVQGAVMRSVQAGRDLGSLVTELRQKHGVARRRAEFIALDQNNKNTAAIQRARQTGLGIEEGIWLHSGGGREPRPTHVANSGKRFSIAEGWYDSDPRVRRRIMPGELPRCRCVWRPVVAGFS